MRATLPDHTELARRLCYWHRTHKNDQARQAMQPRVTTNIDELPGHLAAEYHRAARNLTDAVATHTGNIIEAFLVLSGVEPTGDAVVRHAIILDWATSPLPE
ncbi:hypothetical protein CFAL_11920 (plasmid) [Corynebacterium falsenii DSM 44353]|uniref:hypothetical protein n=1 Tax=Corynebacterium falsenii TaxID=108486 RepID=UPI0003E95C61|nr:hypothetical protein [Corynebacterium falsenii]AHI04392.1 hypothetical protein CFAL_09805 [Corynebacterium falsenii DSM 44353]AHI04461.1 hypothetical protein CFAL_11920 [Corynebacterium falsenii DSM 44353]UBI04605.1 hypothetical protein LA343_11640 [Corynebacterium falsenii]